VSILVFGPARVRSFGQCGRLLFLPQYVTFFYRLIKFVLWLPSLLHSLTLYLCHNDILFPSNGSHGSFYFLSRWSLAQSSLGGRGRLSLNLRWSSLSKHAPFSPTLLSTVPEQIKLS